MSWLSFPKDHFMLERILCNGLGVVCVVKTQVKAVSLQSRVCDWGLEGRAIGCGMPPVGRINAFPTGAA